MKFTEELGKKIIYAYNLDKSSIAYWRKTGKIPDKYFKQKPAVTKRSGAYDAAIVQLQNACYYFALSLLGSPDLANEIVQATNLYMFEKQRIADKQISSRLKPYMFKTIKNKCFDLLKLEARYNDEELRVITGELSIEYDIPFDHQQKMDTNIDLDRLISKFTHLGQKFFTLKYEGYTNEEIRTQTKGIHSDNYQIYQNEVKTNLMSLLTA